MDPMLSVAEAAKIIGISTDTLYNWIRRGEVVSLRSPGGRMKVRESEARRVLAWLNGETTLDP